MPTANYADRKFTTNSTGYPGWKHIVADEDAEKDFSEVIAIAQQCLPPTEIEHGEIVGGFALAQIFTFADKIVEAVKSGPSVTFGHSLPTFLSHGILAVLQEQIGLAGITTVEDDLHLFFGE